LTTFQDLGLRDDLVAALSSEGITSPFPIQTLTIRDALAGRDVCGKAKTGSGKTLAFGLPLLEKTKPADRDSAPNGLVLVPTRELAKQVVEVLEPLGEAIGLRVVPFYGGTSMDIDAKVLRRGLDIAVATPGRLIDLVQREMISLESVGTVVVDEADRMADMGFFTQVDWIMRQLSADGHNQTLLFSATLDGDVDVLIRRYLKDPVHHEVVSETETVEHMTHRFLGVHNMDRMRVVAAIARHAPRTLAFCRTKRGADRLASDLKAEGIKVQAIHGDLSQSIREKALSAFEAGKINVLVATDVAARGIHVEDVDVVIHYDPPEDEKAYLHRSGRTARAGRKGAVATFVMWDQEFSVDVMRRRLGITEPTVRIFSNDPRLADLHAFGEGSSEDEAAS
jgi:superfamily II DNA/RNA helicase